MQDFRKLEVWRFAHAMTLAIYTETRSFPPDERFGLVSQLRRAAMSIEANLAEGCGRGSDSDFARFVQIAMGSASEIECHLLIARDLNLITDVSHESLDASVSRIKRMLASLLKTLKRVAD